MNGASSFSQPSGRCVVCGEKTYNRCSDCFKAGTSYMWFCNIEHKKLVYDLHKRVCGERSNPFQWPGLSSEEIRYTLELSRKPLRNTEGGIGCWFDRYSGHVKAGRVKADDAARAFQNELEILREARRGMRRTDAPQHTHSLLAMRECILNTSVAVKQYSEPTITPQEKEKWTLSTIPICYLYCYLHLVVQDLPELGNQYAPWATKLQHLYLIHTAVLVNHLLTGETSEEYERYLTNTRSQLRKFCKDEIAFTHPREAHNLSANVDNYPLKKEK